MESIDPPLENCKIYALLYLIETALRELVIEVLSAIDGPIWYKRRLQGDILEKYKAGRKAERNSRWVQCVPHHPMYYIDFPDLRKIIEREDNWKSGFERIFARKDIVSASLSELEPIRNKIAHNRKASPRDVEVVEGSCAKLSNCIGFSRMAELAARCTSAEDMASQMNRLEGEASISLSRCLQYLELPTLAYWSRICKEWWFEDSYLGVDLSSIRDYFGLLGEYSNLPHRRGTGHVIEAWLQEHDIQAKFEYAELSFRELGLETEVSQWI